MKREIKKIIIHHSASARDKTSVGDIKHWHTDPKPKGNGWDHIGYHRVITSNGKIAKTLSYNTTGYHAFDKARNLSGNKDSLGICLTGNFQTEKPNNAQIYSLIRVLKDILTRYPKLDIDSDIIGHRDFQPTACPGDHLMADLLRIKDALHRWAKQQKAWQNFIAKPKEPELNKKEKSIVKAVVREANPNFWERIIKVLKKWFMDLFRPQSEP